MNATDNPQKEPSRGHADPTADNRLFPAMWDLSSLPGQRATSSGAQTNEHTQPEHKGSSGKTDAEVSAMLKGMQLDPYLDGDPSSCNRRWPV